MSGARILYPQFRDEQSDSRYPFADSATLLSTSEQVSIARDTFIDAVFYPIGSGAGLYLSQVAIATDTVTLTVGDAQKKNWATARYAATNPPEDGVLEFLDKYDRPAGVMLGTREGLLAIAAWALGIHTFSSAATAFVAAVVIPAQEPGVRGLLLDDGTLLTGDVWLVGDRGVQLRHEGGNVIRVDVIGEPLFRRMQCEPAGKFTTPNFVKTINGCPPDQYGNFVITATDKGVTDTAIRVYPQDNALFIDMAGRKVL